MSGAKEWTLDAGARSRIRVELQAIDIMHEKFPRCVVCGQRCARLDAAGTCSKLSSRSEAHALARSRARETAIR